MTMLAADQPVSMLSAADVMTLAPRTCSVYSSVLEAVMVFRDAGCGAVPVVDADVPVGILTDRDVTLALADHPHLGALEVGDIMTRGVVSVDPGDSLSSVAAKFAETDFHRLLVVGPDKLLRGIIARSDLSPYFPDRAFGGPIPEGGDPLPCTDPA